MKRKKLKKITNNWAWTTCEKCCCWKESSTHRKKKTNLVIISPRRSFTTYRMCVDNFLPIIMDDLAKKLMFFFVKSLHMHRTHMIRIYYILYVMMQRCISRIKSKEQKDKLKTSYKNHSTQEEYSLSTFSVDFVIPQKEFQIIRKFVCIYSPRSVCTLTHTNSRHKIKFEKCLNWASRKRVFN